MNPIIFLDVDGVLIAWQSEWALSTRYTQFDPAIMARMKYIIDATGAKVVVSSAWRYHMEDFNAEWVKYISLDTIVGTTKLGGGHRGTAIQVYIKEHNVKEYIIVDDEISDIIDTLPRDIIVKINSKEGITNKDVDAICSKLGGGYDER